MVFNATYNNISAISWRSALLVEETEVPRKITPTRHKSPTNLFYRVYIAMSGIRTHNFSGDRK